MSADTRARNSSLQAQDAINSDDATWILTSAFIIFTMQSGFGLLESGLVTRKNEVNIIVKNAIDVVFGGLAYWMFGFALIFGQASASNSFIGAGYFFTDVDEINMGSIYSKYFFQLSFATTATTIISGAMAERTNLKAYCLFSFLNNLTYSFPAHWIWAENGWLRKLGAVDIAGSSAVHVVGGSSGLIATIYLRPRLGFSQNRKYTMASPTNVLLGTFMLWWGWLGFNCGSTFGISGAKWKLAARSAVCTINASIGGGISATIYSFVFFKNRLDIPIFVTGLLGGLVGITGVCALTRPGYALLIGLIGGLISCSGCKILKYYRVDDPVGCVPVHLFSGVWSLIAVALFMERDETGYFSSEVGIFGGGMWFFLCIQLLLIATTILWSCCTTCLLLFVINKIVNVRMSKEDELRGADESEHGIHPCPTYLSVTSTDYRTLIGEQSTMEKACACESSHKIHENNATRVGVNSSIDCVTSATTANERVIVHSGETNDLKLRKMAKGTVAGKLNGVFSNTAYEEASVFDSYVSKGGVGSCAETDSCEENSSMQN